MNVKNYACDPHALRELLAGQLNDEQQSALEEHLGNCPACRERLHAEAAEESWWELARKCLASPEATFGAKPAGQADLGDDRADQKALFGLDGYLAPSEDPRMLGRLAGYEIAGVIGCGGMGIVLKGLDTALGRYVAIKVLSPPVAANAASRQRFAREAKAAASVVHDNVMAIHAVGEAGGLPYLVMPYVRGPSLEKRLVRAGAMAVEEVIRIGMQIAAGLAAAHAQGLVHRDIKPANIMLEEGVERVKITDFGLARAVNDASLTQTGVITGTPEYMSPEQARGDAMDCRSDLFSLGSVLHAMCTGRPPFRAETTYRVLRRINEERAQSIREANPAIPAWFVHVVEKLHQKEPQKRFQSAAEVAELLEGCLAHLQEPSGTPLPAALTASTAPRYRMPTYRKACLLLGGLAAALLAGISFFESGSEPGSEKPTIAQIVADLGSDSFAKRENAAKELDKIGAPALEALRKAAQSGDPEQRRRAEELVSRIEGRAVAAKVLTPKRVQLCYQDTRLADALADFQKQSGYSMTLVDPQGELKDRKITLDTGDVTFWKAFDQFCRKARLMETYPPAPNGASQKPGGAARLAGRPGGLPGVAAVMAGIGAIAVGAPGGPARVAGAPIFLTDGTPPTLSTDDGSAMRVRVRGAGSQRPGDRAADALLLALEIQAEPKTAQPEPIAVHVRKAFDDAGQSLDQITNGGGYTGTTPSGALISLDIKKGEKASSSLAELSGTIKVRLPAEAKTDGKGVTFDVPFTLKKVSLP